MPPVDCGNWYVPEVCAGSLRCDYIWSQHELQYIGWPADCGLGDWRQVELDSYQIPILETEWRANVQSCYEQVEAWGEHFPSRMHRQGGSIQAVPPPRIRTFKKHTYQCMCPGKVRTCLLRKKCVPSRGVDLRLPAHLERVILCSFSNSCTLLALFHSFSTWHGLVNQMISCITRLTKKSTVEGLQRSIFNLKLNRVPLPSYRCRYFFSGSPNPLCIWLVYRSGFFIYLFIFLLKGHTTIDFIVWAQLPATARFWWLLF